MIKKFRLSNHENITSMRGVLEVEKQALVKIFYEKRYKSEDKALDIVLSMLGDMYEKKLWIRCDYRQEGTLAIIGFIKRKDKSPHIRRNYKGHPIHHTDCPFFKEPQEIKGISRKSEKYTIDSKKYFAEHIPLGDNVITSPPLDNFDNNQSREVNIIPPLGCRLYTLLKDVGLTHISNEREYIGKQKERIKIVAKNYFIDKDIPLDQYLWFSPRQLDIAKQQLLENCKLWRQKFRPQGFFIFVADKVDENEITYFTKEATSIFQSQDDIKINSGRMSEVSTPYIVNKLVYCQEKLLQHEKHYRFTIEKPLENIQFYKIFLNN